MTDPNARGITNLASGARKKQEAPSKHWSWRLNASKFKPEELVEILDPQCQEFAFQLERGEETSETNPQGYLHYQGCMSLKGKQRWTAILKWLGTPEYLRVSESIEGALNYCTKESTREAGPWIKAKDIRKKKGEAEEGPKLPWLSRPLWLITELRPWQKTLEELLVQEPDRRTIYWVWSEEGGLGKTQFCKYLSAKYDAIEVADGEPKDVFDMCIKMKAKLGIVMWNFSKAKREWTIPYKTIEKIKDGYWFSGKFETGMACINSPHVLIMANQPPDREKMSEDRWKVTKLD